MTSPAPIPQPDPKPETKPEPKPNPETLLRNREFFALMYCRWRHANYEGGSCKSEVWKI